MRGFVHSIEVLIAASILLIGIAMIFKPYVSINIDQMKTQGYQTLKYLDDSGFLRDSVKIGNTLELDKKIKETISYNFMVDICKIDCKTPILLEKNTVVIEYYISGYGDDSGLVFDPHKVKLYIWDK